MDTHGLPVQTNGEAYLRALHERGIGHVFANAGTDFAPIIEGYVRCSEAGMELPRMVTVPHENVAVAMASGYYKISRRMAAVMVHVTVGTANALCGIMNAARGNVPMLLAAGRSPATERGDPGSRNIGIHWSQENFDQGGMVREHVKWDYELRSGQPVDTVVGRALEIAASAPPGPVYLTLPREVLGEPAVDPGPQRPKWTGGSMPAVPSENAIERVVRAVADAELPLIIAGNLGRSEQAMEALAALSEAFAIPVVQGAGSVMPTDHPMNMGANSKAMLELADLVLVLESAVPWIPRTFGPRENSTVIHIADDPAYADYPYRGFASDLGIAGSPAAALELMAGALPGAMAGKDAAVDRRRKKMAELRDGLDERRAAAVERARTEQPIHPVWVAQCLNEVKDRDAILVNELGVNPDFVRFDIPGCATSGGGSAGGLGSGLGEALGAKMAAPDRQVIATVGDGSYMFGVPMAAHFVAAAEHLPTLTVIMNNNQWFAVRRATMAVYPEGRASKANKLPLVDLTPSPDYQKVVEAVGGHGEAVEDPARLPGALETALQAVADGRPAVLNVVTAAGGRD